MARDPFRTRLCEEYGCEYPIVAFSHTKDVVPAVSNAGGIGILGASGMTTDEMRSAIDWIAPRVGSRPWGIDLVLPASMIEGTVEDLEPLVPQEHRDFIDRLMRENDIPEPKRPYGRGRVDLLRMARAKIELALERRVPIFASGLGSPAFVVEEAHRAGSRVWGLVGLARQARREIDAGVDLVIAQGHDAAGHNSRIGTFSIVREVAQIGRETNTPVLAAGGVTTGEHLLAALALGACGVWTGTIWQSTHESEVDIYLKHKLVSARSEDAVLTRAMTGKTSRGLRSKWTEAWEQPGAPEPLPMPLQSLLNERILKAIEDWRVEPWMHIGAGQGVWAIRSLRPARQVVFDLMEEARAAFERLAGETAD